MRPARVAWDTRTIGPRLLVAFLLGAITLLAGRSSAEDPNLGEADAQAQGPAETDPGDSAADADLEEPLTLARRHTRWQTECGDSGTCVFERRIPVRGGRPEDILTLMVDRDGSDGSGHFYIVAPGRANEEAGIWIAFFSDAYMDGRESDRSLTGPYALRCAEIGCGVGFVLTTELKDGVRVSERLSSSDWLWVLYVLDGTPTRALVTLAPLREAIANSKLGESPERRARPKSAGRRR